MSEEANGTGKRRLEARTLLPLVALLALISVPLVIWAASSGGSGGEPKGDLVVQQGTNYNGYPELVVSLTKGSLNSMATTKGKAQVTVVCFDNAGKRVLINVQEWPFIDEPGFDYPHAHVPAQQEQVDAAARCRLRGTTVKLENAVQH